MASTVTFNNLINFDDATRGLNAADSTDGPRITLNNGTFKTTQTTFDYFTDTPSVGDVITFSAPWKWKDIRFNVGTPMNGTPTFVWEYTTGGSAYTPLKVENGNALTKAGIQTVRFTPPTNWVGFATNPRPVYRIRVRLTDVTGVSEGGAQQTDKIQIGDLSYKQTGTASTADNVSTYDLATAYTILSATTPATGIVPIEMSTLYLGIADKLNIILANSTTLGAGDTVGLTGTDINGTAQAEVIDVSGGNGTYVSAKTWQNVTQIDCNGFTDGTIRVDQQHLRFMLKTGSNFVFIAYYRVGDGATTTVFTTSNEEWYFKQGFFPQVTGSGCTYTSGSYETSGKISAGRYGTCVRMEGITNSYFSMIYLFYGSATVTLNGATWIAGGGASDIFLSNNCTLTIQDCKFVGISLRCVTGSIVIRNLYTDAFDFQRWSPSSMSVTGLVVNGAVDATNARSGSTSTFISGLFENWTVLNNLDAGRYLKFINCNVVTTDLDARGSSAAGDGIYIQYYYNLTVKNSVGAVVSGAKVQIMNALGTSVCWQTTDGNGVITQQTLTNNFWTWASGTNGPWVAHTPHTVKIMDYTKQFYIFAKSVIAGSADTVPLQTDNFVSASFVTASAYTGIAIDWVNSKITVTSNHTIQELYDYCKAQNMADATKSLYSQPITTVDGATWTTGFDVVVDGCTLSGSGQILIISGKTFSFLNGGIATIRVTTGTMKLGVPGVIDTPMGDLTLDFVADGSYDLRATDITGDLSLTTSNGSIVTVLVAPSVTYTNLDAVNITVNESLAVTIAVNNIVAGSRIQIYDTGSGTELYNEIVAGTSWSDTFTYTSDINIRIRLMYVDGAGLAYYWYTTTTTITSAGFNVNVAQVENKIYETANIDGSLVTECSISGSIIRIYVDDPDNTTTAQRIYNWYQYYLFTEAGIRDQDGAYVSATDATHYIFDNSMRIINQDTANPLNITGANITPVSGPTTNIFDLTNGASIALNFNRVEGFSYSSGSGLSTEEHDALINQKVTIDTNLNAPVGSIPTNPYTGTPPSAAQIADAVLDEAGAGHTGLIPTNLDSKVSLVSKTADTDDTATRLRLVEKILRNKVITDPVAGKMTLYDDDGVSVLLEGDLFEDAEGLQTYRGQGSERRERLA